MQNLIKHKRSEGFTIIEVMIVLAIAGLIMLIIFLAVPALNRNSRNEQRNHDAALVGAAVNECLNSRNGVQTSCDQMTATELQQYVDTTKLRQLTTVQVGTGIPADTTQINIAFGQKCLPDASGPTGGTSRSVAVLFRTESTGATGIPRCVEA